MKLHELPVIAAGLDHLIATDPRFAAADRTRFTWLKRDAGFGGLLRMILGQQVSTHAAAAMWRKLEAVLPDSDPPRFLEFDDAVLASVGFSRQKMRYGRALADSLVSGRLDLHRLAELPDEAVIETLVALPGIGRWSAEVYLMFCLGRPDVWPIGDLGIVLGMQYLHDLPEKPKPAELVALAEPWRPHRSAAALLVWDHYARAVADQRQAARAARPRPEHAGSRRRSQQ